MEQIPQSKILWAFSFALFLIGGIISYNSQNQKENQTPSDNISASVADSIPKPEGCIGIEDAQNFVGKNACVSGVLEKVFVSKSGTIFLDFCKDYKTCPFTAVIFKSASSKFPDIKSLEGKSVSITGLVKTYQGKPEIILNDPSQLK